MGRKEQAVRHRFRPRHEVQAQRQREAEGQEVRRRERGPQRGAGIRRSAAAAASTAAPATPTGLQNAPAARGSAAARSKPGHRQWRSTSRDTSQAGTAWFGAQSRPVTWPAYWNSRAHHSPPRPQLASGPVPQPSPARGSGRMSRPWKPAKTAGHQREGAPGSVRGQGAGQDREHGQHQPEPERGPGREYRLRRGEAG
jgi:hypothetical protein